MHGLQDFYAHSNWIEVGNVTYNPYIGNFDQTAALLASAAGPNQPTCTDCAPFTCAFCIGNISTASLTSAYFQFAPGIGAKPIGKCSHGGTGDFSDDNPATGGINKDSLDCDASPHSYYHTQAAGVARLHTKQFIRNLKERVTLKQFKALLGVGNTLAFAIDTTGSMSEEIAGVRQQAIQIVQSRVGTDLEPSEYVLAEINDPYTNLLADTIEAPLFINAINGLYASGGGDCPELQQTGLLKALNAMDDGGELIMFTDASARDDQLAPNVRALAQARDVQISTVATGSCSPIDPEYYRTATETGGQVFVIFRSEADNLTPLVDFLVRPNAVDVLAISDTLTGTPKTYRVPVDATMTRVTFSVSGTTNVTLRRPDGSTVQPGEPEVSTVLVSGGRIYSITNPAIGAWELAVNGAGALSIRASGESTLYFSDFNFVELSGWPGHDGYAPIAGLPLANQPSKVDAEIVAETSTTAEFELRAADGSFIQSLNLAEIPKPLSGLSREFFGDITTPNVQFLVYARGTDTNGNPYQRVIPGVLRPQTVRLLTPPVQLAAGQTTTYTFQVENLGAAATFRLSATDDRGFVQGLSSSFITLATNQIGEVTAQLFVPANVMDGTIDTLTLSARSQSNVADSNFAVVAGTVTSGNTPPDVGGAQPSISELWPANHELVGVNIEGVTDADGDPITVQVTRVMQDEPTNGNGDGNACPDATGLGTATARLRAERGGGGNGRVYTIFFTASDGRGGNTPGRVKVAVPHSIKDSSADDGPLFDATVCP